MNANGNESVQDYELVERAIRHLEENYQEQPSLEDLAAVVNVSPFHLQRVFARWAGISPKRFVQYLTVEHAKRVLTESRSVLEAAYDAGLSSPGRLHDLFVTVEAVTPGEYKQQGGGVKIAYGRHATPFGEALVATTERGVCALSFVNGGGWDGAVAELAQEWPEAELAERPEVTAPLAEAIFADVDDRARRPLPVVLKGTNFQIKVWEALLRIPAGAICSYADVAQAIGEPKAARAVGGALNANTIAYLIPCHRVIRSSGVVSDYRWGHTRKQAMLGWEAAHRERAS